jgi:hypothetical protein
MASHWLQAAFGKNKGLLHRETGTPEGKPIPVGKLKAILKSSKSSTALKRRAALAMRVKTGDLSAPKGDTKRLPEAKPASERKRVGKATLKKK